MVRLVYWDKKLENVESETAAMATRLHYRIEHMGLQIGQQPHHVHVMGPAPAPFPRFRSYYRWQILLRAPDPAAILHGIDIPFGWRIDIDPVSVL